MKNFVREQKISKLSNRLDYLKRQGKYESAKEELIYFKDDFKDWQKLVDFENAQARYTNQARELIIALPNEMANENGEILEKQKNEIDTLCKDLVGNQPHMYAVHWNETKTNLHVHLLYSERKQTFKEREPKTYRRDVWLDKDTGKMAKKGSGNAYLACKKGDIQRDKDGNIKYKEAVASGFSEKNTYFKSKQWLLDAKERTRMALESFGYSVEQYNPKSPFLAEKHQGRGQNAYTERIRRENEYIRKYNKEIEPLTKDKRIKPEALYKFKVETSKEFKKGVFNRAFERIKLFITRLGNYISQPFKKLQDSLENIKNNLGELAHGTQRAIEQSNRSILQLTSSNERQPRRALQETSAGLSQYSSSNISPKSRTTRTDDEIFNSLKLNYRTNQILAHQTTKRASASLEFSNNRELERIPERSTRTHNQPNSAITTPDEQDFAPEFENRNQSEQSRIRKELEKLEQQVRATTSIVAKTKIYGRISKLEDELDEINLRESEPEFNKNDRDDDWEMEI